MSDLSKRARKTADEQRNAKWYISGCDELLDDLADEIDQLQALRDAATKWVGAVRASHNGSGKRTWKDAWDRWQLENAAACELFQVAERVADLESTALSQKSD